MFRLFRPELWLPVLLIYFSAQTVLHALLAPGAAMPATGGILAVWIDAVLPMLPVPLAWSKAIAANLVLLATFACTFLIVRRFGQVEWAWMTMLCLFLVPQIAWVGQHSGGGSCVPALASLASVLAFAVVMDRGGLVAYGLFGAAAGLAALSAPMAAAVPVLLLVAALTHSAGLRVLTNRRMAVAVLVAAACAAPAWPDLMAAVRPVGQSTAGIAEAGDMVRLLLQATLTFAGFLLVAAGLLFHHGLGAMSSVDPRYLHLRQILARLVALGFVLLPWLGGTEAATITLGALTPFLILLVPLGGLYLAPLLSTHMKAMATRGALVVAALILLASPSQYTQSHGGLTAWYLELRASQAARTPLL